MIAIADEVAAAADLARDKTSGTPVVVVSGLGRHVTREDGPGAASLRRSCRPRPLPLGHSRPRGALKPFLRWTDGQVDWCAAET